MEEIMPQWKVRTRCTSTLPNETWTVDSWKQKHLVDNAGQAFQDTMRAIGVDNNLFGTSETEYELIDNVMFMTKYFASEAAYNDYGSRVRQLETDESKSYPFTRDIVDQKEVT